jgi:hypothetical protein
MLRCLLQCKDEMKMIFPSCSASASGDVPLPGNMTHSSCPYHRHAPFRPHHENFDRCIRDALAWSALLADSPPMVSAGTRGH